MQNYRDEYLKLVSACNFGADEPIMSSVWDSITNFANSFRESIVLPLLTIQQFALKKIQQLEKEPVKDVAKIAIYQKLVMRSLFGNINASRNSA